MPVPYVCLCEVRDEDCRALSEYSSNAAHSNFLQIPFLRGTPQRIVIDFAAEVLGLG